MSTRVVFTDGDHNQMECYLGGPTSVFFSVGREDPENIPVQGFIALSKEDVGKLIELLTDLHEEMAE